MGDFFHRSTSNYSFQSSNVNGKKQVKEVKINTDKVNNKPEKVEYVIRDNNKVKSGRFLYKNDGNNNKSQELADYIKNIPKSNISLLNRIKNLTKKAKKSFIRKYRKKTARKNKKKKTGKKRNKQGKKVKKHGKTAKKKQRKNKNKK
tara:strand:- start:580 stop:1020 length:441 start_codon:yes stop_codon:yes gene_type:complete